MAAYNGFADGDRAGTRATVAWGIGLCCLVLALFPPVPAAAGSTTLIGGGLTFSVDVRDLAPRGPEVGYLRASAIEYTIRKGSVVLERGTIPATDDPFPDRGPVAVANLANDLVYVLWMRLPAPGADELVAAVYDNGTWLHPVTIETDVPPSDTPNVAIDPLGRLHLAWKSGQDIRYVLVDRRLDTIMTETLTDPGCAWEIGEPRIAIDQTGVPTIFSLVGHPESVVLQIFAGEPNREPPGGGLEIPTPLEPLSFQDPDLFHVSVHGAQVTVEGQVRFVNLSGGELIAHWPGRSNDGDDLFHYVYRTPLGWHREILTIQLDDEMDDLGALTMLQTFFENSLETDPIDYEPCAVVAPGFPAPGPPPGLVKSAK